MGSPACKQCGTATESDARFCGVCGNELIGTKPAARQADSDTTPDQPIHPNAQPRRADLNSSDTVRTEGRPAQPRPASSHAQASPASHGQALNRKAGPPTLERLVGQTLSGRYLVENKIGEGGFGAVFRGRQVGTGRQVALKILHPHNVTNPTVVARFRREAEACSKLSNPHTVVIYDFDEAKDGTLFLAMELLHGKPLQDLVRTEGPFAPARALAIIAQVAESLGEAHAKGVIHRDMKPENVMVESREGSDFVKVLDFGIAKLGETAGPKAPVLTAIGQTLGTLEFMSPEQLRGRPLDGRSDLYALGIMAYEMLTGMLPWREARTPIEIIKFHLETEAPPPSTLGKELGIPRRVDELVLKMVAKEPADRHADAAELREEIVAVLRVLNRRGLHRSRKFWGVTAFGIVVLTAVSVAILG